MPMLKSEFLEVPLDLSGPGECDYHYPEQWLDKYPHANDFRQSVPNENSSLCGIA